jgi:hypothetical protein
MSSSFTFCSQLLEKPCSRAVRNHRQASRLMYTAPLKVMDRK